MAKLELHNVYERFRGDMFLNSLIESSASQPNFYRLAWLVLNLTQRLPYLWACQGTNFFHWFLRCKTL